MPGVAFQGMVAGMHSSATSVCCVLCAAAKFGPTCGTWPVSIPAESAAQMQASGRAARPKVPNDTAISLLKLLSLDTDDLPLGLSVDPRPRALRATLHQ